MALSEQDLREIHPPRWPRAADRVATPGPLPADGGRNRQGLATKTTEPGSRTWH